MRTIALSVVALGAALALARCGGNEGGLSTEQFARKANAICGEANEKVKLLGPEPTILTAEQADWIEQLTEIDRGAVERLGALEPPKEEQRAIVSMVSAFERGLGNGEEIARASRMGNDAAFRSNVDAALDALKQAQVAADDHGLKECARLGTVVR